MPGSKKSPSDSWNIAGVYVTEACVVVLPAVLNRGQPQIIGSHRVPRTKNRPDVAIEFSTSGKTPAEVLAEAASFIRDNVPDLLAVHVACFGGFVSSELGDRNNFRATGYGKLVGVSEYPAWVGTNIYEVFFGILSALPKPPDITVGTDVDAAAYGEYLLIAKQNIAEGWGVDAHEKTLVFLSLSRTINGGVVKRGDLWSGVRHPQMSYLRTPEFKIKNKDGEYYRDLYGRIALENRDGIQSLIGVNAIEKRTRLRFEEIKINHFVWEVVSYYIAQLCINLTGVYSPSKIVLGGRIIKQTFDQEFAENMTRKIRGYFYTYFEGEGVTKDIYEEVMDVPNFIVLPRPVETKSNGLRRGLPGRHGALRLAALRAIATE